MGDRTVVKERVVEDERRREGEIYVGGFGGFTWGHDYDNAEGTGSLKGAPIGSLGLANSVVYGAKIGYFHPGRLNWLGLEIEGFNTTPHIKEGSGLPGSNLRVTTLALNVIARTKLGCRTRDHDYDADRRDDVHGSHGRPSTTMRDAPCSCTPAWAQAFSSLRLPTSLDEAVIMDEWA